MSAEDLDRFGSLYLTEGKWNDTQVVPSEWIEESVIAVSHESQDAYLLEHPFMEGYAYLVRKLTLVEVIRRTAVGHNYSSSTYN